MPRDIPGASESAGSRDMRKHARIKGEGELKYPTRENRALYSGL